ncbi:hypothetical protein CCACVL1_25543 [Corchorus capsularis]|uniref:Uncharacterized protein n=1 Tax=Corchorus capsularis TaxID=210143 RepID=A0A1R3GJC8_COCAP|nr:hypothetical protein CCACVL1_25543 [Corchorus capsularis]
MENSPLENTGLCNEVIRRSKKKYKKRKSKESPERISSDEVDSGETSRRMGWLLIPRILLLHQRLL